MTAPSTAILHASAPGALLHLAGRTLLDRALDRLVEASVSVVLVDAGSRAVAAHLSARRGGPEIVVCGDAGDLRSALQSRTRPGERLFIVDGDVAWFDGPAPALRRLAVSAGDGRFDRCLMLARTAAAGALGGRDGLALDPLGVVRRPREREIAPFVDAGVQIARAEGFEDDRDRAIARGRLGGLVHDGVWFVLPTAEAAAEAEASFEDRLSRVRL